MAPLAAGRVAIQPRERRLRKQAGQSFLDALGALADRIESLAAVDRKRPAPCRCAPQ